MTSGLGLSYIKNVRVFPPTIEVFFDIFQDIEIEIFTYTRRSSIIPAAGTEKSINPLGKLKSPSVTLLPSQS